MLGRKDYFGSIVMGVGGTEPVRVRETHWGFIIQSPKTSGLTNELLDRAVRFGTIAVWVAVIGLWLVPIPADPQQSFVMKAFASVGLLGVAYAAVVLTKRMGGYAVEVDTSRRVLRTAVLTAKGQSRIKARYRFDEIGKPILERGRTETATRSLCLRLKEGDEVIPVAAGDEMTLLAVHDRLMRDLRPVEERMAARTLPPLHARRARQAFPMLGPTETVSRARRV